MAGAPPPPPPPPAATAAQAPQLTCPSCHAPLSPGQRFCPSCGAPAPAPPPPPAGGGPPDIRQRVDQDRGFLKKLQLLIPGYRAYRQGEDVRVADELLRIQAADRLVKAMQQIDDLRSDMARDGPLDGLAAIGGLRSQVQRIEGQVRHAEQGYTGISPALRMTPETIDRLYEYDYNFISSADSILTSLNPLRTSVQAKDSTSVNNALNGLRTSIRTFESTFSERVEAVEKILQG